MIHILLPGHMVCVCQYWTYERGQDDVSDLGLIDEDVSLLKGVN
jgi:hypothetical protein